ncbi:MAG: DsbA family oxidoreductase [Chloroflexi bacterium]|nr:DsbA family oxidoreductase [Chloroflexota bacterium]
MRIDVFADVVCPWCYIGEARLKQALQMQSQLDVELVWHPFQLRPDLPPQGAEWGAFAAEKFGDQAEVVFDHVKTVGAAEGLHFDFSKVASAPNTSDAHRLILYASQVNRSWEMATRLFEAYFSQGANLNDHAQLAALASSVGFDANDVHSFLATSELAGIVSASQGQAYQLGVSGVPFFIFAERYAVSGAQPVEVFNRALDMANEAAPIS